MCSQRGSSQNRRTPANCTTYTARMSTPAHARRRMKPDITFIRTLMPFASMQGSRRQASGAELVTSDMPSYLLGAARHWQVTIISNPGITALQMHRVLLRNMCHVSNGQRPASSCDNPACPSSRHRLTVRNRGCCKLGLLLMPQDTDCT